MIGMYKLYNGSWVPHDCVTETAQARDFSNGDICRVEIKQSRNPAHHRKAFALLQLVYENLPEHMDYMYPTFESFLTEIKLKCGWYDKHISYKRASLRWEQSVLFIPKSISFGSMDQTAFREFYDRMFSVILDEFLPEIDSEELEIEVLNFEARGTI